MYFADYEIGFYGGKDLRILETDIAFILTLIPIGFFITSRNVTSLKNRLILNLVYVTQIIIFYCLFCFIESQFIKYTVDQPLIVNGILKYHMNNVNYRTILLLTIISTFTGGLIFKLLILKKPAGNTLEIKHGAGCSS